MNDFSKDDYRAIAEYLTSLYLIADELPKNEANIQSRMNGILARAKAHREKRLATK